MTKLNPLEEALFQTWARAHGIENQNDPKNQFDHRGLYKQTNGSLMPGHVIRQMADAHNQAANQKQEGGDVTFPDPYSAMAEMHGNIIKAQGDQHRDQAKMQLEREKMQHKTQLEQMKLQHKSQESEKDRQHKAQAEQMKVQQQAQQAEHQRQMDMQMAHQQRQYQMQDMQTQRAQQLQDTQMNHQHEMQSQLRQEHFARTRPQAQPTPQGQPPAGMPNQMEHGGPPQHQGGNPNQPPSGQPQGGGLQQQLMQRQMMRPR